MGGCFGKENFSQAQHRHKGLKKQPPRRILKQKRKTIDHHEASACRRFAVVGATGSGKTTFSRELAARLGITHIELDALHWGPNWTELPDEVLRASTLQAVARDAWVADGNYHQVRDIIWPRAEAVVWLDYPFRTVLRQLAVRTFKRVRTKETLWNGNRERLATQLFTRDSIFLWLLQTYWKRRKEYAHLLGLPENSHLRVVRLRSPKAAQHWLDELSSVTP